MSRTLSLLLVLSTGFCPQVRGALPEPAPSGPAATLAPPPSAPPQRSAAELEKLAVPIALHPDPLISIILPAAVYPVEIVQAARFVKDKNNVPKLDEQPWDENVKAVAKFPQLIAQMDADLTWTVALGQAFLDQPKELMDAIQGLRAKAQKAGTLQTTQQQIVTVTNMVVETTVEQRVVVVTNTVVQIQPSNPQVVYVPTYPPTVYYPPPAYVYDPYAPLVTFGVGVAVGAIIANNCDWHGGGIYVGHHGVAVWGGGYGDVDIDINRNTNINRGERPTPRTGDLASTTGARPTQQKWQPDQSRLRTAGAPPSAQTREARGWGGTGGPASQFNGGGTAASRPSQPGLSGAGSARPAQQPSFARSQGPSASTQPARNSSAGGGRAPSAAQRPASSAGASRPSATPSSFSRPSSPSSSAFSGVGGGSSARSYSSRGSSSMGGGGFSGGRGGGGRGGGGRR